MFPIFILLSSATELTIRPLKDKIMCFCVFFMSFYTHSQTYCFRIFLPIFPPPPSATLVNGCLSLFAWTQPNTQKPNRLSISLSLSLNFSHLGLRVWVQSGKWGGRSCRCGRWARWVGPERGGDTLATPLEGESFSTFSVGTAKITPRPTKCTSSKLVRNFFFPDRGLVPLIDSILKQKLFTFFVIEVLLSL